MPREASPAATLPTHPAYIPRTMTPGALGGRPSRTASVSGSASSEQSRKKPSYAMQVYLDGRGDDPIERAPSRNVNVQLGGPGQAAFEQGPALQSPPDRAMTGTPAISSLILPSVPKIRLPSKKPSRLQVDESAPLDQNMGISGPLAFPDSRFLVRPSENDRIVEQTVDRAGRPGRNIIEVPIGSGKSYLCG